MTIIEAHGLARTFRSRKRTVEAVRGVDLSVAEGEIVGFLGPNGAGKTTTLRMLTTLLSPTAGTATVAGADLLADPVGVRRRIGYVPQAIGATGGGSDPNATVAEELTFQARMYRVPAGEIAARAGRLAAQLELAGLEDRLVKTLSGGQRRRLDIALGLVHSPRLVFLDEPTHAERCGGVGRRHQRRHRRQLLAQVVGHRERAVPLILDSPGQLHPGRTIGGGRCLDTEAERMGHRPHANPRR